MGAYHTQNGFSPDTWRVLGICLAVILVACRLIVRRLRRRRLIAMELRLESAWHNLKASMSLAGGVAGSRRVVGLASSFLIGLEVGPQGRVHSMCPLDRTKNR